MKDKTLQILLIHGIKKNSIVFCHFEISPCTMLNEIYQNKEIYFVRLTT